MNKNKAMSIRPRNIFIAILAFLLIIIILVVFLVAYQTQESDQNSVLKDRISKYCLAQGGSIDSRDDGKGGKFSVCILKNGTECDAEKFFYGQCNAGPIGSVVKPIGDKTIVWGNLQFIIPEDWSVTAGQDKSLILNIPKTTGITLDVYSPEMLDTLNSSFVINNKSEVKLSGITGEIWNGNTMRSKNDRFKAFFLNTGDEIYFLRTNIFGSNYLDEIIKNLSYNSQKIGLRGDMCGGIAGFKCSTSLNCKLGGDYPDASGKCE